MSLRGRKIYVIEYSVFIAGRIESILTEAGAEVRTSANPTRALLDIVHWNPDAIVSNVNVGEMTGFELCLILKMMPDHAKIPFIILSSSKSEHVKAQIEAVGADYYIPKDQHFDTNTYKAICRALNESDDLSLDVKVSAKKQGGDTILVVDDSSVMRRIICNILASLGITKVAHAENGKEALARIGEQPCSMVLTDWNMPVMNGLELVYALRERDDTCTLPIIMITTEGASAEREQAEKAGVNAFLPKPFTRDSFRQVLQKFL